VAGSFLISKEADVSTPLPTAPAGPFASACCAPTTALSRALDADRIATIAKALAEPVRVHLLDVLHRHGEPLCQCELRPLFELPQSTLSHHLSKLAAAGLIDIERRHRWAYYSIRPEALQEITTWLK
jgi:ArsR family transcriptional regulator